jgi:hypothetical protein
MMPWLWLTAIAVSGQLLSSSAIADLQKFYIRNQGPASVADIRISPDYSNVWGDNILGSRELAPGRDYLLDMSGYGAHCTFDLRIEDTSGAVQVYSSINLCQVLYFDHPQ